MAEQQRLDQMLVKKNLAPSRQVAQRLIMAGEVMVDGVVVFKPAARVSEGSQIVIRSMPRFVSRGGEKLLAALQAFPIKIKDTICADVGASTGGFTDCLLQHGARKVYAIDVGKGILDYRLRTDERVVVMESTNARYLERLPEQVDIVTIDASFISLKILLPVVMGWLKNAGGDVIALIKPQFEAGRKEAAKHKGVIRDRAVHRKILIEVISFALAKGYSINGLLQSPLRGPKGNVEFLAWLHYPPESKHTDWPALVDHVVNNLDGGTEKES